MSGNEIRCAWCQAVLQWKQGAWRTLGGVAKCVSVKGPHVPEHLVDD